MVVVRLKFWNERFKDTAPSEISSDDIEDALAWLEVNPKSKRITVLSPKSLNLSLGVLSTVLNYGKRRRLMPRGWQNPCETVVKRKGTGSRTRYLTEKEYSGLLAVSRLSSWRKLTLLLLLAVTTGARKGSLLGLTWGDLDLARGEAYIERTKNGTPFTLILHPTVLEELTRHQRGQDNELIFESTRIAGKEMDFTKHYKQALKDAGIEGACFHTLRHTHASWLARNGASLLQIADSLNHKTLSMVRRYSHLCTDSRRELMNKVFG
jgi:integrase